MESTKFKCPYCGKEFTRERTLQVHMCEPKRRHLQKNEKWVQNGFIVFQRFYEIHQKSSKKKTYDDFCGSSYYNAFVKFGRFMMHTSPLYPEKYIDYVVLSGVKLDHWSRDDLYEQYLKDTLKTEPVEAALRRSIATMMDWATEQNVQWADYFRLVNTSRGVQHIQSGKISPWLVLGCEAGKKMLQSFSDEQLQMIQTYIDPEFWRNKFKNYPADYLFVQETAKEAHIE
jgi:sarcosine oxidase delta subunit